MVMIDGLHPGRLTVRSLSLSPELFDIFRLDLGYELSSKERDEMLLDAVTSADIGTEPFDLF